MQAVILKSSYFMGKQHHAHLTAVQFTVMRLLGVFQDLPVSHHLHLFLSKKETEHSKNVQSNP